MFNPNRPAQEMTCAELMAAHIASGNPELSGKSVAMQVASIYISLNDHNWDWEEKKSEDANENEKL